MTRKKMSLFFEPRILQNLENPGEHLCTSRAIALYADLMRATLCGGFEKERAITIGHNGWEYFHRDSAEFGRVCTATHSARRIEATIEFCDEGLEWLRVRWYRRSEKEPFLLVGLQIFLRGDGSASDDIEWRAPVAQVTCRET